MTRPQLPGSSAPGEDHAGRSSATSAGPTAPRGQPDLRELLQAGEGQRLEFKSRLPRREERVAHLLAALANGGGGTIAVGVDDAGHAVGTEDPEAVHRELYRVACHLLDPPPHVTFETLHSEAGPIVLAHVAPTPVAIRTPFSDDKTTYVRVNDRNVPVASEGRGSVRLPGGQSAAQRLDALDRAVRERFTRAKRRSGSFGAVDYARRNNVSLRTARRDIRSLRDAFLVVETSPGVYEALEE